MAVYAQVLSIMYLRYRKSTIRVVPLGNDDGSTSGVGAVHASPGFQTEESRVENRENSLFKEFPSFNEASRLRKDRSMSLMRYRKLPKLKLLQVCCA